MVDAFHYGRIKRLGNPHDTQTQRREDTVTCPGLTVGGERLPLSASISFNLSVRPFKKLLLGVLATGDTE